MYGQVDEHEDKPGQFFMGTYHAGSSWKGHIKAIALVHPVTAIGMVTDTGLVVLLQQWHAVTLTVTECNGLSRNAHPSELLHYHGSVTVIDCTRPVFYGTDFTTRWYTWLDTMSAWSYSFGEVLQLLICVPFGDTHIKTSNCTS